MVAVNHLLMAPMLKLKNGISLRESGLFSFQSLSTDLVLAMLGVATAAFWLWNPWLVAVRRRAALPDPPLAVGPAAPGGGACRPEDGPLQRAPLHVRAQRGADRGGALRAAAFARHGRPRPPARHQQHVRPPRRRRGPAGDRRGLPRPASPLRRAGPLRRRGVRDPASGDAARPGVRDRRADPARGGRAHVRRRDLERADPRDRLDRRRRLPARRRRRQRAHPRGRPRRLPRQAPGTQPRARRELGAAPRARRSARRGS